jgi:hypothetical protein
VVKAISFTDLLYVLLLYGTFLLTILWLGFKGLIEYWFVAKDDF